MGSALFPGRVRFRTRGYTTGRGGEVSMGSPGALAVHSPTQGGCPGADGGVGLLSAGPRPRGGPYVDPGSSRAGRPAPACPLDDGESLGEAAWLHATPPGDPGHVPKPLCTLGEKQMCWPASQVEPHNPEPPQPQFLLVAKRLHLWVQPQVLVSGSLTSWVQ